MRKYSILLLVISSMLIFSCSSYSVIESGGKKSIVDSGIEDDKYIYQTGIRSESARMEDALNDARRDAYARFSEAIKSKIMTVYERARVETGVSDEAGRVFRDGMILQSKTIATGAIEIGQYWEHIEKDTPDGKKNSFRAWSRVRLSKEDYKRAIRGIIDSEKKKARKKNDKKAEDMLRKMQTEFEKQ